MTDPQDLEHAGEILRAAGICAYPMGDDLVIYRAASHDHWRAVHTIPHAASIAGGRDQLIEIAMTVVRQLVRAGMGGAQP